MPTSWGQGVTWHDDVEWRSRHGDWPTAAARRPYGVQSITEYIVHHSGNPQHVSDVIEWLHGGYVMYTSGQHLGTVYADLGYNAVISSTSDAKADIWQVRHADTIGGHTAGHNTYGYGVCYLRTQAVTKAAERAFVLLERNIQSRTPHRLAHLVHSDCAGTACPGDDLRTWVHSGGLRVSPAAPNDGPPGGPAYPGRSLAAGKASNRAAAVKAVQGRLGVTADGNFGPITTKAVKAFQKAHGLAVDGQVGKATWLAMFGG